jgi:pimeloyl-ACP methyl ester carboxylesterase
MLLGQSRGGFLSIIYAGRHPAEVSVVISFAGGWVGGRAKDFNTKMLREAGVHARAYQLWPYGEEEAITTTSTFAKTMRPSMPSVVGHY